MHKMSLAKTYSSVKEKRVIYFTRRFCNCERRCVGKVIIISHDKSIKSVLWIKTCFF